MTEIEELQGVIRKLHRAKATHRESVHVTEVFQGKTIWDGMVEVFDLKGHPETHRAYAWTHETDDPKRPRQSVTVLHIPPVISPQTAVQAIILQEIRGNARSQAQA
jgi:hypothetical protein